MAGNLEQRLTDASISKEEEARVMRVRQSGAHRGQGRGELGRAALAGGSRRSLPYWELFAAAVTHGRGLADARTSESRGRGWARPRG